MHTVNYPEDFPAYRVIYWGENAITDETKADCAEVEVRSKGWLKVAEFALPSEKSRLDEMLTALAAVYRAGEAMHARELASLLP